jgi:hypothetical protein
LLRTGVPVEKPPLLKKTVLAEGEKMSAKIENVVYRASGRDEISANFESVSFSTATGDYTHDREPPPQSNPLA